VSGHEPTEFREAVVKNYQDIPIKKIERDESTQARVRTDDDVAGEYSQAILAGDHLPEPVVFFDGKKYWLGDGWHTVRGYELAHRKVVRCEVRDGSRSDAIIYAAGANTKHGLRRTSADKRRAVWLLLQHCSGWSNRDIAHHACVSHQTVANVKEQMVAESGKFSQTMEVANNGQGSEASSLMERLTPAQRAVYQAMTPKEREKKLEQSKTDALDERLIATEVIVYRIQKRLGDDELGKAIRQELNLYLTHMRGSVGWTEPKRTVIDDHVKDRTLTDLDRARKLNNGMPGERQRTPILDRLVKKVKEAT
jgi:hypothetical protein